MLRALVCIPNRSNFVVAWSLQYAIDLKNKGFAVTIIDLSRFSSRYILNDKKWYLDKYSVWPTTGRTRLLKVISKEHDIKLIDLTKKLHWTTQSRLNLSSKYRAVFENAVRSSYARWFGSADIRINNVPKDLYAAEEKSFIAVYETVSALLNSIEFNLVSTVNGRFVVDSALISASRANGIQCNMIEKCTENWDYYMVFQENPQSIKERHKIIHETWLSEDKGRIEEKVDLATKYLEKRIGHDWIWRKNISAKKSVDKFGLPKRFVSFFLTTEYEFAALELSGFHTGLSQAQTVSLVAKSCAKFGLPLVLRGHPHPSDLMLSILEDFRWKKVAKGLGAIYLECNSDIDSLDLARLSHVNFVHTSSIGVDLNYLGLPIYSTCDAEYTNLVPEILACNETDIFEAIAKPQKPKKQRTSESMGIQRSAGRLSHA